MNPGVSLQSITDFPNLLSQNSIKSFLNFESLLFDPTISSNLKYLGGLKK